MNKYLKIWQYKNNFSLRKEVIIFNYKAHILISLAVLTTILNGLDVDTRVYLLLLTGCIYGSILPDCDIRYSIAGIIFPIWLLFEFKARSKINKDDYIISQNAVENKYSLIIDNKIVEEYDNFHKAKEEIKNKKSKLIYKSKKIEDILAIVRKVAITDATVLILGESGTGKEVIADEIYENSNRNKGPFIKINCGALPENLLESELFGYEKGAFTGANTRKLGKFDRADGGTIFLDELGEISQGMQVKLLRVLQEKEFERVGGNQTIKVDIRVIAATNKV